MKPKKIAIVYSGAKYPGGIETYLRQLFSHVDRDKLELVLFSLGDWALNTEISRLGGQVVVLPSQRVRFKTVLEVSSYCLDRGIGLIVSQGVVANFYARLVSLKTKIPNLVTVHSELKNDYPKKLVRFLYALSDRMLRFQTVRFVAVSYYLKQGLVDTGVFEKKVAVVYNGVEPSDIKEKAHSGLVIGSIGRLHLVKGFAALVGAMPYIEEGGVKLVIWGEGEERKNLQNIIKKMGLEDRVTLAGYNSDLGAVFSQIDIYAQPSLSEGFGLTVVEAMLAGKPVVVTPAGSLPELIKDGKTGLVSRSVFGPDLAKCLNALIKDAKLRETLAQNASRDAKERFSVEKWVSETTKVYLETAK